MFWPSAIPFSYPLTVHECTPSLFFLSSRVFGEPVPRHFLPSAVYSNPIASLPHPLHFFILPSYPLWSTCFHVSAFCGPSVSVVSTHVCFLVSNLGVMLIVRLLVHTVSGDYLRVLFAFRPFSKTPSVSSPLECMKVFDIVSSFFVRFRITFPSSFICLTSAILWSSFVTFSVVTS